MSAGPAVAVFAFAPHASRRWPGAPTARYLSASAPGSRWDICAEYEVAVPEGGDDEDEDLEEEEQEEEEEGQEAGDEKEEEEE